MDSINSSEKSRTPVKIKNSATNTEPARCGFCGSGIYFPAYSQASSARAFCPGSPRCKQPSDICNDNFSIHQPLFSSPPLLQPLFSNILVPSNLSPAQSSPLPSKQFFEDQEKSPRRPVNSTMNFMFYHNNNNPLSGKVNEDPCLRKTENGQKEYEREPRSDCFPFPLSCECTSAVPWTYSPFIMPIFSYYVFCNSMFSNNKIPPVNPFLQYDFEHSKNSSCESAHRRDNKNKAKQREEKNGEFWSNNEKTEKNECKASEDITGSSTSFVSVISVDYGEETFLNPKKKNDGQQSTKNEIDNFFLDNESIDKLNLEKKYPNQEAEKVTDGEQSTLNQSGKNLCKENYEDKLYMPSFIFLTSSEEQLNDDDNSHYCETSESKINITDIQKGKTVTSDIDIRIGTVEVLSEDEYSSFEKLQEKIQEKKLNSKEKTIVKSNNRERTPKKCIKNFTMADEIHYQFQKAGDKNTAMTAGGDLGENCVDQKVKISTPKKSQAKDSSLSDETDQEITIAEKNIEAVTSEKVKVNFSKEDIKKLSRSNTRSWSNSKSRIAKLTANFKSKDAAPQANAKQEIETEGPITNRKHNCLANDITTENETNWKIQKIKNCENVQKQNIIGTNKKNSRSKTKNKTYKGKKSKAEKQSQNSRSQEDLLSSSQT